MKKIDRVLKDFSELKVMENWLRNLMSSRRKHPLKSVIKNYRKNKPKRYDEMIKILKSQEDSMKKVHAYLYVSSHFGCLFLLKYINTCISVIKDIKGFKKLIKNLQNPEQFKDTLSEIEFNAYFAKRYSLELEPSLGNKKLDSKINLDKRNILFEIITPKTYKLLENSKKAIMIPNRSKNKFLDKIDKQIAPSKELIKFPLIIVVNTSHSEIDEFDIENALLGEFRFNFIRDNKTGKIIHEYEDRNKNSLNDTNPLSRFISAILIYNKQIGLGIVEFKKSLVLNDNAKYPLNANEYKKLLRFNLGEFLQK